MTKAHRVIWPVSTVPEPNNHTINPVQCTVGQQGWETLYRNALISESCVGVLYVPRSLPDPQLKLFITQIVM